MRQLATAALLRSPVVTARCQDCREALPEGGDLCGECYGARAEEAQQIRGEIALYEAALAAGLTPPMFAEAQAGLPRLRQELAAL
ncbi:hypothetical protein QOL99_01695 [Deinococcus sp. MIMF12]|uniref:ComF family protein n=1 Tax=Deinococcus rhizophilus TaxID=3049544 RepID=A0ABT7JCS5_9DEIO|nr:hypothetical protein [Deinococcus rhizophilus]MDL2342854.1 hypothetical protein [Deinococcus rhizophilus]